MILTIVGAIYFSACAAFLLVYRRALRRATVHPMTLLPRRNNVLPFRPRPSRSEPSPPNVESVNNRR